MRTPGTTHGAHHRALEPIDRRSLSRAVLDPNTAAGREESKRIVRAALLKGWLSPKPFGSVGDDYERPHTRKECR